MSNPSIRCLASCVVCLFVAVTPSRLPAGVSGSGIFPLLPNPPPIHWSPTSTPYISIAGEPNESGGISVNDGSSITADIVIADGPGSSGSLVVQDTDSAINGGITIGDGGQVLAPNGIGYIDVGGTGDLLVRNGGRVAGNLTFGAKLNSVGTGLVENSDTLVSSDVIQVGHLGSGSLTIRDGAEVDGVVDVGHFRTGVGEIIVSGSGSKLTSGSSLFGSGNVFLLGSAGQGTLRVEAGGYASALNATLGEFYNASKPKGQATITGAGSMWEVFGTLVVGADSHGDNAVTVQNGGLLRTGAATISWGRAAATAGNGLSRGQVTVTGAGSTWINESGPLVIGGGGLAILTISNGGALVNQSTQSAVIGNVGVATTDDEITGNSVLVTGVGSQWTNTGDLKIGYRTRGTVEIAASGKITATEVSLDGFRYQSPSLLILRGDSSARGVLETGLVMEGPGPGGGSIAGSLLDYGGAVRFDGGILRATRNEADFIRNFENGEITVTSNGAWFDTNGFNVGVGANLSGAGGLTKVGAGTLTLTNTSSFTGPTSVESGKLVVNGLLATTVVTVASGAALGGDGSFGGLTTITAGGHLAPGNSPGTITFNHGLALAAGAILDFDLGTISDLINVTGGLLTGPAGGTVTLNFSDSGGFGAGTYTLIDGAGASFIDFSASSFTFGTVIDGYTYDLELSGDMLQLTATATATAIPEPTSFALIVGVGAMAVLIRRRRRSEPETHAAKG